MFFSALYDTVRNLTLEAEAHWIHSSWELANPSGNVTEFRIYIDSSSSYDNCAATNETYSTDDSDDCKDLELQEPLSQCTNTTVKVYSYIGNDIQTFARQEIRTLEGV